jgi:hypothetical protein
MAAALKILALETPVLAAGIWSAGAMFSYGSTYIDKVDSWIHHNGTASSAITVTPTLAEKESTKGPETPLENQKNPVDLLPTLNTFGMEKSVTGTVASSKQIRSPTIATDDQNDTLSTTTVVPTHIAEPKSYDTTFTSICDVPAAFRPFWCTLQELGAFSPLANFIYVVSRRIPYLFQSTVYRFFLKPVINGYPTWRLLVVTTSVICLAIFPCHARRTIYNRWRRIYFWRRLIFSTGVLTTMAYENNPLFHPCFEDRCIISAGVVLVLFLDAIVPHGAFTNEWDITIQALHQDIPVIWASLQYYATQLWDVLAHPNRYVLGTLCLVLLSNYWQEINQMVENPGPAGEQAARFFDSVGRYIVYEAREISTRAMNTFNTVHTATSPYLKYHWNSAPQLLEYYNTIVSRHPVFKEYSTRWGIPVLRLFTLSMIPSVFYYLLRLVKLQGNIADTFAPFLPFPAIIIAGWCEISALNLASITISALVDANIYYRGKEWSVWEHFHLLSRLLYFWTIELTIVPLLKAVGRLPVRVWKFARSRGFVFNLLLLALFAGVIDNLPLRWFCWRRMNATVCIPTPNTTQIYDELYRGITGPLIYLSSRIANGWDGFWAFVLQMGSRILTTMYIVSKDILHSGSKHVTEFCGSVAHALGNLFQWLNESRIHNQEVINIISRILFWSWALYKARKFWGYLTRGGGDAGHPPGPPARPPAFPPSSQDNDHDNGSIGHQSPPHAPAPSSSGGGGIRNISQPPSPPIGVVDGGGVSLLFSGAGTNSQDTEHHFRDAAAATIKQTYRTYKSNKILKCWKTTVASALLQAAQIKAMHGYVTAVERQLDAEEALLSKMEHQLNAEEARIETERVEATRVDAEREGKDEKACIETERAN